MKNVFRTNVWSFAIAKLQAKMRSILAIIAIVAVIGLFSLTVCACASTAKFTIEDIEEGKAFSEPYFGFADPSKPVEQQSIIINLFDIRDFKPVSNDSEVVYVSTEISSIDWKEIKVPTGKSSFWDAEYTAIKKYQIIVVPPGKHTIRIKGEPSSTKGRNITPSTLDYIIDLLPGKIYILRQGFKSGFFATNNYSLFGSYAYPSLFVPEAVIEIADPNRIPVPNEFPLKVGSEIVTVEQVIRGVNAKFARK